MARLLLVFPARIGTFRAQLAWSLALLDFSRITKAWYVLLVRLDAHSASILHHTALSVQVATILSITRVSAHVQLCTMLTLRLRSVLPVLVCAGPASALLFAFLATPTSFGTAAAWPTLNVLPLTSQISPPFHV